MTTRHELIKALYEAAMPWAELRAFATYRDQYAIGWQRFAEIAKYIAKSGQPMAEDDLIHFLRRVIVLDAQDKAVPSNDVELYKIGRAFVSALRALHPEILILYKVHNSIMPLAAKEC